MTLAETVKAQLSSLLSSYQAKMADNKLSWMEALSLTTELIGAISSVQAQLGGSDEARREAVRAAIHEVVDEYVCPLVHQGVDFAYDNYVQGRLFGDKEVKGE